MHVAFDMISAGTGFAPAAGGMTTYYEGLAATLPETSGVERVTAFLPPGASHAEIRESSALRTVRCADVGANRVRRVAYEHLRFPTLVASSGADVLLSTHNVKPWRWRGASVVVLQSIQWALFDDAIGVARRAYLKAAVPRSLRSADRVISVSETTRHDAVDLFDLDPDRVVAVHHGPSPWAVEAAARFESEGVPPVPPPASAGQPYLVIVSSLYGLKNHKRLIEAFAIAKRSTGAPHLLVVAGREADVTIAELADVARRWRVDSAVHFTGAYPQRDLPALIANAQAVVYPSLYETFGHPVLEAFAFRRPLLTSAVSGCAEVAGDAAIKVDPTDTESIAAGLVELLTDERRRSALTVQGALRLSDFSWEQCAAQTASALLAAVASHAE